MNRRSFFGALAAVVAAGKAAPRLLAKLTAPKPLAYEEMPLGLIDVIGAGESVAIISPAGELRGHGVVTAIGDGTITIDRWMTPHDAFVVSADFPYTFTTVRRDDWQRAENARLRRETTNARSFFAAWERQVLG